MGILTNSIARIRHPNGTVVGAGIHVGDRYVLTCAHVVNLALLKGKDAEVGAVVTVDLPFRSKLGLDGIVVEHFPRVPPIQRETERVSDTAVLKLSEPEPDGLTADRCACIANGARPEFVGFGFPYGASGTNADGKVTHREPGIGGWLQVRALSDVSLFVKRGFSGGPAFDPTDGRLLGMIAAADETENLAFIIPVEQLERAWPPLAMPYQGLRAFDEEAQRWFRGRKRDVADIIKLVLEQPVVTVLGASGSGKSSVIKAGVIPALKAAGWAVAECRVGEAPHENLSRALVPLLYKDQGGKFTDRVYELSDKFREKADKGIGYLKDLQTDRPGCLIYLDQFEELFTRTPEVERAAFDALLDRLVSKRDHLPKLHVVLTLRSDFIDSLGDLGVGRTLLNRGQFHLTRMRLDDLQDAVRGPAAELGVDFEPSLDDDVVAQVYADRAKLPLMQYALQQLWLKQHDRKLTRDAFNEFDGLEGVLATTAEKVFADLTPNEQSHAGRLFLKLVNVSEGLSTDTKRVRTRSEIGDELWRVAQPFAAGGVWLLRVGRIEKSPSGADATVELAHEALIRNWDRLAGWLDGVREVRLWMANVRFAMSAGPAEFDVTWSDRELTVACSMLENAKVDDEVRVYARQRIGNSLARDLWNELQSQTMHDQTLLRVAGAAANTRTALIERLLALDTCAETLCNDHERLTRALVGLDPERRQQLGAWIEANAAAWIEEQPEPVTQRFAARCGGLLGLALDWPIPLRLLLKSLCQVTYPLHFLKFKRRIATLSRSIDDPDQAADQLLQALHSCESVSTYGIASLKSLGYALSALAPRLDDPEEVADQLLEVMQYLHGIVTDPVFLLTEALVALAPRIEEPMKVVNPILDALSASTEPAHVAAFGPALADLAPWLDDPDKIADQLFQALQETTGRSEIARLSHALAALAERLENSGKVVNYILLRLNEAEDPSQIATLSLALAELAPGLDGLGEVTDKLLRALHEAEDPSQIAALTQALSAIAPSRLKKTNDIADQLLQELRESSFIAPDIIGLGKALAALAPRLDKPAKVTDELLQLLCETTESNKIFSIEIALAGLAKNLRAHAQTAPPWFALVFGALRNPFCASPWDAEGTGHGFTISLETACIEALGVAEGGTLWDALKRFQALYPDADMTAPWPEPLVREALTEEPEIPYADL